MSLAHWKLLSTQFVDKRLVMLLGTLFQLCSGTNDGNLTLVGYVSGGATRTNATLAPNGILKFFYNKQVQPFIFWYCI